MSAAPPPPPPRPPLSTIRNLDKTLLLAPSSSHFSSSSFSLLPKHFHKNHQIRCQLSSNSFDSPTRWTVDCVSGSDPIHIILKPTPSSISMASTTTAVKSSKKVCLFYCAEMKALAERIAAESDSIELRSITWRYPALVSKLYNANFQFICM